jgi:predicted ATPase/DNA-binding CsgD family transcriptional regulator
MKGETSNPRLALVGRQREAALLWSRFETAIGGRCDVTCVTGEPGIGKTRLLEEMAARAARSGAVVLWGDASAAEGMPPYLPFLEALGQHIQVTAPGRLHDQVGSAASILVTILPELAVRLGEFPDGYPLPAEQARLRLFEAVGGFLAAIAASSPGGLLLILDDLQWADAASLDLLCHVARRRMGARVSIQGAYREGEVGQNPALERALVELNHLRALTTLTLAPLRAEEIAVLAADYLGGPVAPIVGQALHAHSEGNPFFAEELLREWLEAGVLTSHRDGPHVHPSWTLTMPLESTLPPSIVGAIRQRLTRFTPVVVDHLRVAAIIGRTFTTALLAEVEGHEVEEVEEELLAAERAHLIRGDGAGAFTFGHDKVRECLCAEVSSARRRRLHGQIGLALEVGATRESTQRLAEMAFHFSRSDDRARGIDYSRRAAEQALHACAPQEAITHYQAALDLLDPEDKRRGDLLLALGEAALPAAAAEQAISACQAAQAWFEHTGDLAPAACAAHILGLAYRRMGAPLAAQAALERSLALLEHAGAVGSETVHALADLADLLGVVLGRHEEALINGQRALEIAQRLGDDRLEAAAGRAVGFLLVRENDIPAGLPLLERGLALASASGDLAEAAECCACLAQAYCWTGEMERSRQISLRREALARRGGLLYHACYVHTWLAFLHAAQGDWAEAEQRLAQAHPAVDSVAGDEPLAFLRQVRGYLAYQRGDYSLAEQEFRAAVETFRGQDPGELVLCLGPLGLTLLATGRRQAVRACMDEQEALIAALSPGCLPTLSARGCLALMAVALDDGERAARYYPDLLACRGQHHWFLVDRILGQIATMCGDWPAAAVHLDDAEAIAQREGLWPEMGRILLAQADLSLAQDGPGSAAHARRSLGQAQAIYRKLDVDSEAGRVRARLHDLPRQPGAPAPIPLPAGLTRREAQVLRLVAAGRRNREIAQELTLSESTIAKHLTSIFNKVGVDNRAAAAAFAVRHGLA